MQMLPTEEEVIELLRETGSLREGHFVYPDGSYTDEYLGMPLVMSDYKYAKVLSVALSRKIRADSELRAMIPHLSVVAPATGGLPVAYGVVEALGAKKVYWSEPDGQNRPNRFREFVEPQKGEKVLLVDDIFRTGTKMSNLKELVESYGAEVVGMAVMIYQPWPDAPSFDPLPFLYLAKLDSFSAKAVPEDLKGNPDVLVEVWS